ncbi:MAG: diaminopimelate epimerase, partial [Myxococcales bacterium]|nr:diaminopimelate epimerase [Myxococcales bacterium]
CGNGLRCVAAQVAAALGSREVLIATDAGLRSCEIIEADHERGHYQVRIAMGPARLLGEREPAAGAGRRFLGVSMGNPHAVCFVAAHEDPEALARGLGPGIEVDPAYQPARTNVEFARVEGNELLLWVWERGVGITAACGTGACATAAAAVRSGLLPADTDIVVHLPGGPLTIRVPSDPSGQVMMTGAAVIAPRGVKFTRP